MAQGWKPVDWRRSWRARISVAALQGADGKYRPYATLPHGKLVAFDPI